jgi:hypothetical protein
MKYLILLLMFGVFDNAYCQVFRHYKSEELEKTFYTGNEWKQKIREREIEFEQYFKNEFLVYENDDQSVINLQVVFNILQTEDKKVSLENIKYQLNALNAAFNNEIKMPEDDFFRDKAYSAGIQFCVPEYNETFIRTITLPIGTEFSTFFSERGDNGLNAFEPNKYINIWVADLGQVILNISQEFSVAGFTQLPLRDPMYDGIVIDIDHFGEQPTNELYNKGYTLAHLMGIYLGIRPLWGLDGEGQCGGDGVNDTPTHPGPGLICLPQTENQLVVSSCWGNERMMNRNFMDNTPDECQAMFTIGQRRKMHRNLGIKGPRRYLLSELPISCDDGKVSSVFEELPGNGINKEIIRVSPNPAYNLIKINLDTERINTKDENRYAIYDGLGQLKESGYFLSNKTEVNIESLNAGLYFLVVINNSSVYSTRYTTKFEVIR